MGEGNGLAFRTKELRAELFRLGMELGSKGDVEALKKKLIEIIRITPVVEPMLNPKGRLDLLKRDYLEELTMVIAGYLTNSEKKGRKGEAEKEVFRAFREALETKLGETKSELVRLNGGPSTLGSTEWQRNYVKNYENEIKKELVGSNPELNEQQIQELLSKKLNTNTTYKRMRDRMTAAVDLRRGLLQLEKRINKTLEIYPIIEKAIMIELNLRALGMELGLRLQAMDFEKIKIVGATAAAAALALILAYAYCNEREELRVPKKIKPGMNW